MVTKNFRRLSWLEALTFLGFAVCCALILWTFLPWVPQLPIVVLVPLVIGLLVVWFPSILQIAVGMQARYGSLLRLSSASVTRDLPQPTKTLAVIFGVGLVLSALTAAPSIAQGNPEVEGGRTVINNHGTLLEVTTAQYWASIAAHERFAAAVMALFFGFAIVARNLLKSKPLHTTSSGAGQ